MHLVETLGHLVQSIPAEVLRIVPRVVPRDISHRTLIHVLENDAHLVVEIVNVLALYQLIAIQIRNKTCLIYSTLLVCHYCILNLLHRESLAVASTVDQVDLTVASLSNLLAFLIL